MKEIISYYDGLHDWHVSVYSDLKEEFEGLITEENDVSALDLLLEDFKKEVYWTLYNMDIGKRVDVTCLNFDEDKKIKVNCDIKGVGYDDVEKSVQYFNENKVIQEKVKEALIKFYGYTGEFYFHNDSLPF